jgi:hypothetical protein
MSGLLSAEGPEQSPKGDATDLLPLFLLLLFFFCCFLPKKRMSSPQLAFSHPKIPNRSHKTRANPAFPHIHPHKNKS